MSKKKVAGGNTMTLKDFHGGYIPSDLPLPSAPGLPADRSGSDRPGSRGLSLGRPDQRARPHSSSSTRPFDDKTPFLTPMAMIGRNFDEDERKPLDGGSIPKKTISDENFRVPQTRVELMPEPVTTGRGAAWQGTAPVAHGGTVSSSMAESGHLGKNLQNGPSVGRNVGGSHQNVWTARREANGVVEPFQSTWSEQSAAQKLAHASALEKVSSGRWQSKNVMPLQVDANETKHLELGSGIHSKGSDDSIYPGSNVVGGTEYVDAMLMRHANINRGVQVAGKHFLDHERAESPKDASYFGSRTPPAGIGLFTSPFGSDGVQASSSDDSSRLPQTREDLRSEPVSTRWGSAWQGMAPVAQSEVISSPMGTEAAQNGDSIWRHVGGPHQSAWAAKEETTGIVEPFQFAWSEQNAAQKLSNANALDKVSSGRWHSKNTTPLPVGAYAAKHLETGSSLHSMGCDDSIYHASNVVGRTEYVDAVLMKHMERGLNINHGTWVAGKQFLDHETAKVPIAASSFGSLTPSAGAGLSTSPFAPAYVDGIQPSFGDGSSRAPQTSVELRPEPVSTRWGSAWQGEAVSSSMATGTDLGMNMNVEANIWRNVEANIWRNVGGPHQNSWGAKKEATGVAELFQSTWSEQNAGQKLADASALENVDTSILHSEGCDDRAYMDVVDSEEYVDAHVTPMDRGLNIDHGIQVAEKECFNHERAEAPTAASSFGSLRPDGAARLATLIASDAVQPSLNGHKYGWDDVQPPMPSGVSRPKLKLLPRTKPWEKGESAIVDHNQLLAPPAQGGANTCNKFHGIEVLVKPDLASPIGGNFAADRPKLNLKPRSQSQLGEGNDHRERNSLFGGARPREQVLKDRGLDDMGINKPDILHQHSDGKEGFLKTERAPATRHSEHLSLHPKAGKNCVSDPERGGGDMQKRNWRNENKKNNERQASPETWRNKPVEQPKSSDAIGLRHGKVASAVELAQAFSRSVSNPNAIDGEVSGQRILGGRSQVQMPFSRLMDPTPRPKINGY